MATKKFYLFPPFVVNPETNCLLLFLSALVFLSPPAYAQTNISGVVNTYYKVVEVIPAKAGIRLNTVTGLAYGDKVMLVQMKGASINTTNSASFGDTTALNNAGNYEIADVCYIRGDTVFFVYVILNQYTVLDKVQLVKIPKYVSANVSGTLQAAPWNNAAGTGGVLAIYVEQDLSLNAPVSADTSGYRGGSNIVSSGSCSDFAPANSYYYNATFTSPQSGAYKGEGAVEITPGYSGGRGAPANGGGGGNNHNNGGAGGANLTAAGDGGGNSSTTGCTATRAGLAGKALSSHGGKKIFMGGGGGAGHGNNGLAITNGGGHGGAIVFIRANNLVLNGYKVSANGQIGGPALSDGASGGGAGGTIIMNVNNYLGSGIIEAKGGDGGTENDGGNIGRCYGAGGGGSGGAIYFSGSTPGITVSVNGGGAGPDIGRDVSCAAAVLPGAGSAGQIIPGYSYSNSMVLQNNYCSALLPAELIWFRADYTGGHVTLHWNVGQPEALDFFTIEKSTDGSYWTQAPEKMAIDAVFSYEDIDYSPQPGYDFYRIKITAKNNAVSYSAIQRVYVPGKNEMIHIYPNPAKRKIIITGISSSFPGLNLFDLSGKLLWQKTIIAGQSSIEIELPALPAGLYVLKVGEIARRLVIRQ